MGPTGIPKAFIDLSIKGKSTPSWTRAVTSTMNGARHLFTKNPTSYNTYRYNSYFYVKNLRNLDWECCVSVSVTHIDVRMII